MSLNPRCWRSFSPISVAAMLYQFLISYSLFKLIAHLTACLMRNIPRSALILGFPDEVIEIFGIYTESWGSVNFLIAQSGMFLSLILPSISAWIKQSEHD